jgi:hypothetical protein
LADEKSQQLLEQAYQSAVATLARATLPAQPGKPVVSREQIRAAEAIVGRYERVAKAQLKAEDEAAAAVVAGSARGPVPEKNGGKVRLTESGAEALKAWMENRGVTLQALGDQTRTHAMWSRRLLRREGAGATLEQIGMVVAYAGGELTAGQLVGLELAAQVPQLQAIGMPPAAGQGGPSAPAGGPTLARAGAQPEFKIPKGTPKEMLEAALQQTKGETARSKILMRLIDVEQEEREKGAKGADEGVVLDIELVQRFEDLMYHCQRQWIEADDLAKRAKEAEAAVAKDDPNG